MFIKIPVLYILLHENGFKFVKCYKNKNPRFFFSYSLKGYSLFKCLKNIFINTNGVNIVSLDKSIQIEILIWDIFSCQISLHKHELGNKSY